MREDPQMKFRNVAPYALDVPSLGVGTIVQPGDVVEVADPAVAEGMDGQSVWEPVDASRTRKAPKTPEQTPEG